MGTLPYDARLLRFAFENRRNFYVIELTVQKKVNSDFLRILDDVFSENSHINNIASGLE